MATSIHCEKCGKEQSPGYLYCSDCGAFLEKSTQEQTQQDLGTGRIPTGRILHNRYRILRTVGQGGMGAVYIGQDIQLGDRLVAVKEMSLSRLAPQEIPQATEQFKREAHLLASLQHPNLPHIYEYFSEGERWYLIMSFIQGETLQAHLDKVPERKLPVNQILRIGVGLCTILDYLHSHQPQIIFRDLKPRNIMITARGEIYLIDFGIARHFKPGQSIDTNYYYSAGYAPPEQYGQSQTSPRSDVYSLGVTLHQMLTGYNPASTPLQIPALHLLDPTLPVPLIRLVTQMLELEEKNRPGSVILVKQELEQLLRPTHLEQIRQGNEAQHTTALLPQNQPTIKKALTPVSASSFFSSVGLLRLFVCTCMFVAGVIVALAYQDYGRAWIGPALGVTLILGAIAFLTTSKRPLPSLIQGSTMLFTGNLFLYMLCFNHDYSLAWVAYNNSYYVPGLLTIIACVGLTILGGRLFCKAASAAAGVIVGAVITITGAALAFGGYSFFYSFFSSYSYGPPNIVVLVYLSQVALGIAIATLSYHKGTRRQRGTGK